MSVLVAFPDIFPRTVHQPFIKTSQATKSYNCIAWAADDDTLWYEPDDENVYFWPKEIPREYTIEAYTKLYEFLGYTKCGDGKYEEGFIKVGLFALDGEPTHAARQLNDGTWTSKLGQNIDVSHSLFSIEGGQYGQIVQYFKKPITNKKYMHQ